MSHEMYYESESESPCGYCGMGACALCGSTVYYGTAPHYCLEERKKSQGLLTRMKELLTKISMPELADSTVENLSNGTTGNEEWAKWSVEARKILKEL